MSRPTLRDAEADIFAWMGDATTAKVLVYGTLLQMVARFRRAFSLKSATKCRGRQMNIKLKATELFTLANWASVWSQEIVRATQARQCSYAQHYDAANLATAAKVLAEVGKFIWNKQKTNGSTEVPEQPISSKRALSIAEDLDIGIVEYWGLFGKKYCVAEARITMQEAAEALREQHEYIKKLRALVDVLQVGEEASDEGAA